MKSLRRVVFLCAFVGCLGGISSALADENPQQADRSLKGDAVCTKCHDESEKWPVLAMYKTRHGVKADTRTPGCQTCHGASEAHVKNPGGSATSIRPTPDVTFGAKGGKYYAKSSPQVQSDTCVDCHQGSKRIGWQSSTHANRDVACTSCHQVHSAHDKVRDKLTQFEVCFTCHKEQRAQINRPSHHPIKEGKVSCSSCHNPHGDNPKQLVKSSVNETCYTCHMEKRGPFVHNHQPVTEDCTICHNPHGSTIANLLKARPPFLCQECHNHSSHPSQASGLPAGRTTATTQLGSVGRGCLNCHTNIHGGNSTQNSATAGRFRR